MTADDVAKMEGRELDAELHHRLFGVPWKHCEYEIAGKKFIYFGGLSPPGYYTDEGSDFFALLAKLRENGWHVRMEHSRVQGFEWWVGIYQNADSIDELAWSHAPTLPLALARAAVLTTMEAK